MQVIEQVLRQDREQFVGGCGTFLQPQCAGRFHLRVSGGLEQTSQLAAGGEPAVFGEPGQQLRCQAVTAEFFRAHISRHIDDAGLDRTARITVAG
ncbi:hypothetical protein GCM10018962_75150 [Dactylosporangium matsuzakiense]